MQTSLGTSVVVRMIFWQLITLDRVVYNLNFTCCRFLKLFTEISMEQIVKMESWEGSDLNKAKVILADEATKLLHGEECLPAIHETVKSLFSSGGGSSLDSLAKLILDAEFAERVSRSQLSVVDLVVKADMAPSKNEAKKLIRNGGIKINDIKVADEAAVVTTSDFDAEKRMKLSAGKKKHMLVLLS